MPRRGLANVLGHRLRYFRSLGVQLRLRVRCFRHGNRPCKRAILCARPLQGAVQISQQLVEPCLLQFGKSGGATSSTWRF